MDARRPLKGGAGSRLQSMRGGFAAMVIALCAVGCVLPANAEESAVQDHEHESAPQAGMKVYVDPETGEFLEAPATKPDPGTASPRAAEPPPLVMEPSPVPGGGTGFQVPDQRFDSEIKAVTKPDGSANVDCGSAAK